MKLIYQPTLDAMWESAVLLLHFCGEDANATLAERLHGEHPEASLSVEQITLLNELQLIQDELKRGLALTVEEKALLRPDYDDALGGTSTFSSALFPFINTYSRTIDEVVAMVSQHSEARLRGYFLCELLDENDPRMEQFACELSFEVFVETITGMTGMKPENALHIMNVFANYHRSFQMATGVVRRLMALMEATEPKLEPFLAKWSNHMKPVAQQGSKSPVMRRLMDIGPLLEKYPNEIVVRPGFANPISIHIVLHDAFMSINDSYLFGDIKQGMLCFGLAAFELENTLFDVEGFNDDDVLSALKMLSDKSKYDILCILKEAPCYGAQLAQKLGLSPATISHHMNALLSMSLVRFDAQDNRMYYRLNNDRITALISKLQQTFLAN